MAAGSTPPPPSPTPLGEATRETGLEDVETYITRIQNMVVQYIAMREILDLCEEVERRPEPWV